MDPISIALGLSQFVPAIVRWLAGEKAGQAAETVVGIAQSVTGKATGPEALEALRADQQLQRQFQERMPQAIRDLIEDELGRMEPRSKQDFERILNLEWFRTPKYKPDTAGADHVAESASGAPEFPEAVGLEEPATAVEPQPRKKPVKDPLDGGRPAIKCGEGVDAPEVRWVGEDQSDLLRGHAGEYVAAASGDVVYCNKDYRLFGDLVSTMRDSFPQHDERQIIEVIREQYEVTMVCLVVGWRKMKATRAVTDEGVLAAMIEPQAFSTAVLASYLTHHNNTIAALRKANPAMQQVAMPYPHPHPHP